MPKQQLFSISKVSKNSTLVSYKTSHCLENIQSVVKKIDAVVYEVFHLMHFFEDSGLNIFYSFQAINFE